MGQLRRLPDPEYCGSANRACALGGRSAIFQRNLLSVLNIPLGPALETISLHLTPPEMNGTKVYHRWALVNHRDSAQAQTPSQVEWSSLHLKPLFHPRQGPFIWREKHHPLVFMAETVEGGTPPHPISEQLVLNWGSGAGGAAGSVISCQILAIYFKMLLLRLTYRFSLLPYSAMKWEH